MNWYLSEYGGLINLDNVLHIDSCNVVFGNGNKVISEKDVEEIKSILGFGSLTVVAVHASEAVVIKKKAKKK